MELELIRIVRTQIWPTDTQKHENWNSLVSCQGVYEYVYHIEEFSGVRLMRCSCKESLIPIFERYGIMGKQDKPHVDVMMMLVFNCTVLLMCMRTRDVVGDANGTEKGV
jgi:hypothetical protein